jgi:hypothetical protein
VSSSLGGPKAESALAGAGAGGRAAAIWARPPRRRNMVAANGPCSRWRWRVPAPAAAAHAVARARAAPPAAPFGPALVTRSMWEASKVISSSNRPPSTSLLASAAKREPAESVAFACGVPAGPVRGQQRHHLDLLI